MSSGSKPKRIEPEFHTKIWGSPRIEPWFDTRGDELTGEVWFPAGDLLVKFLFTSQDLSVQVHPGDEYARIHANSRGKTEMWHILRAEPGARIALGFRCAVSATELVAGAQNGQILNWLNWVEVRPGDTYLIPSGTVHAISAGIALCEIQQNSDITYRLYDYGRNRPLHLQHAIQVTDLEMRPEKLIPREIGDGFQLLAECPYFRTYQATFNWNHDPQPRTWGGNPGSRLLIVLEGSGRVNGLLVSAGQVLAAQVSTGSGSPKWVIEPGNVTPPGSMQFLLTG